MCCQIDLIFLPSPEQSRCVSDNDWCVVCYKIDTGMLSLSRASKFFIYLVGKCGVAFSTAASKCVYPGACSNDACIQGSPRERREGIWRAVFLWMDRSVQWGGESRFPQIILDACLSLLQLPFLIIVSSSPKGQLETGSHGAGHNNVCCLMDAGCC